MPNLNQLYKIYINSCGVSIDTRRMKEGCLFICLKGENFNGNEFVEEALSNGATCVITEDEKYINQHSCFVVKDGLQTLQMLAAMHRKQLHIPVIGITGTNGKTTTKELIASVLSTKYKVVSSQGNFNNHIGVPLTVLSVDAKNTQIAVVEMGANHFGEIEDLCQIAQPNYGLITNIGKAHLEGFGFMDNIVKTKIALYQAVENNEGKVFVNASDELLMDLSCQANRITYGNDGQYSGEYQKGELNLNVYIPKENQTIKTKLAGSYNFLNVMAAYAAGSYFDIDFLSIKKAIENYTPTNGRSQIIHSHTRTVIVDAYNANPTSMQMAIRNLLDLKENNKAVILGDMYELGEQTLQEHQAIVDLLQANNLKHVYLLGQNFAATNAAKEWIFRDETMLENALKSNLPQHGVVLLKGSHGMRMEQFIDVLTNVAAEN